MNTHLTDGELRAALDHELEPARLEHLKACSRCQTRQQRLQAQSRQTADRLAFLAPTRDEFAPEARFAWQKFSRQNSISKEIPMFKRWFSTPLARAGVVVILALALFLSIPGTRALASQFLELFRVQQVAVVPVDFTGLEQLTGNDALAQQFSQLISNSVDVTQEPGDPVQVGDAAQAGQMAGFSVRLPQGSDPSQITVNRGAAFTMTADRAKAQALLNEAGRGDLVLPASVDGAKISVTIPTSVSLSYGTCPDLQNGDKSVFSQHYPDCVMLAEIPSPTVEAPDDVDVAQLAQIGLEFTGMNREQAEAFTNSVDWTSTLVIPIPRNGSTYEQVSVDGVTGTLIQRPADDAPQYALIWVKDGIIYAISGLGSDSAQAIDMANSMH